MFQALELKNRGIKLNFIPLFFMYEPLFLKSGGFICATRPLFWMKGTLFCVKGTLFCVKGTMFIAQINIFSPSKVI